MTDTQFPHVESGEWVQPIPSGYLMKCCDCGLVHRLDFRVMKWTRVKKKWRPVKMRHLRAQFRAFRHEQGEK